MSGAAFRILPGVQALLRNLNSRRQVIFSKYLLATNTTISVVLMGLGDFLEQHSRRYLDHHKPWDKTRTGHMCGTGLVFGPMSHYWYHLLDRYLPGKALRTITQKIVLDQMLFSPAAIVVYLSMLGCLEGARVREILSDLIHKGPKLFIADCIVWPPAQFVNFYLLPTRYRVLYDNSLSLAFDFYYARVKYDNSDDDYDFTAYSTIRPRSTMIASYDDLDHLGLDMKAAFLKHCSHGSGRRDLSRAHGEDFSVPTRNTSSDGLMSMELDMGLPKPSVEIQDTRSPTNLDIVLFEDGVLL